MCCLLYGFVSVVCALCGVSCEVSWVVFIVIKYLLIMLYLEKDSYLYTTQYSVRFTALPKTAFFVSYFFLQNFTKSYLYVSDIYLSYEVLAVSYITIIAYVYEVHALSSTD